MGFTLRSTLPSPVGRKVLIAADLLGLGSEVTFEHAELADETDSLRQQNPLGKVPTLVRDFMLGSMWDVLHARFETDEVRAVLGFTSTFGTNAGPRTPGTAYVMAHHMFGGAAGVKGRAGYVRGGMGGSPTRWRAPRPISAATCVQASRSRKSLCGTARRGAWC